MKPTITLHNHEGGTPLSLFLFHILLRDASLVMLPLTRSLS